MRARRDRGAILAILFALSLLVSGCADDGSDSGSGPEKVDVPDTDFTDATGEAKVAIAVPDNSFDPKYVIVSPGTKVTWTNEGRNDHNVVPVEKGSFEGVDRDEFGPNKVHSATFTDAGDYAYYCSIHGTKKLNGQAGVIRVEADETTTTGA